MNAMGVESPRSGRTDRNANFEREAESGHSGCSGRENSNYQLQTVTVTNHFYYKKGQLGIWKSVTVTNKLLTLSLTLMSLITIAIVVSVAAKALTL